MIRKIILVLAGLVYDLVCIPLIFLALLFSIFLKKLRGYIITRSGPVSILHYISACRKKHPAFLLCSSIGELEQAIPLINELELKKQPYFIFFHSKNGLQYAQKLGYTNCTIMPFDLFTLWLIIFLYCPPSHCIINRHEFWPGFIFCSVIWKNLFIINAVQKENPAFIEKTWRTWIYHNSNKVFFVNNTSTLKANQFCSGDTRWDRLVQRYHAEQKEIELLKTTLIYGNKKILLLGNAYINDASLLSGLLNRYPAIILNWQILIIPSRPQMATAISDLLGDNHDKTSVIPVIGKLFQYYACADIAWVGGGFDKTGVHNTLEPAYFHIPVISGPCFNHQPDALLLKEKNGLHTFNTVEELNDLLSSQLISNKVDTVNNVSPTKMIMNEIF